MNLSKLAPIFAGISLLCCAEINGPCYAVFYKEVDLIGGYSDNEQWIAEHDDYLKNSVGFEYYDKFSMTMAIFSRQTSS